MALFSLGNADSDGEEGIEDDEDQLEMTKYDEGEVAVNEEDELAVGFWRIFSHISRIFSDFFLEISSTFISGGSQDDREDEYAHSRHHHHQWHRHEGKL